MERQFDEERSLLEMKHEHKMEEIAYQAEEDRKTEELKAKHARKLEGKKILGVLGKVVLGVAAWGVGSYIVDRIGAPRNYIPKER